MSVGESRLTANCGTVGLDGGRQIVEVPQALADIIMGEGVIRF
jgi:hypothetical protein